MQPIIDSAAKSAERQVDMKRLTLLFLLAVVSLCHASPAMAHLHPNLQRFVQRDPLVYVDGLSLCQQVGSNPVSKLDPSGRQSLPCTEGRFDEFYKLYSGDFSLALRLWQTDCSNFTKGRPSSDSFKRCQRTLRKTDCKDAIAGAIGSHGYVQTDANGTVLEITNSNAEAGSLPESATVGANEVISCKSCWQTPANLKYGSGAGKPGTDATDAEIQDCLSKTPMRQNYFPGVYDCNGWADDAVAACGLFCK